MRRSRCAKRELYVAATTAVQDRARLCPTNLLPGRDPTVRHSCTFACAAAVWLTLQGFALAQIGGIAPEPGLGDPPANRRASLRADGSPEEAPGEVERASYTQRSAPATQTAAEEFLPEEL